ncbi:MAG: hypothetical protein Q7S87_04810 [Agitococcus sp.]|nr:hypothetical protein [Agitococcus sp.]
MQLTTEATERTPIEVQQIIAESLDAYRQGYRAFENSQKPPSELKKHEAECFAMGFNRAKEGHPYPNSQRQESEALTSELSVSVYSEGCSDA